MGGVVSIGNFDGVHIGHRVLLSEAKKQADAIGGPTVAIVFDPHPSAILRADFVPEKLTWIERRAELMGELDIEYLLVIETTESFLSLSAKDFFQSLIVDNLRAKAMIEGPNFFFGRGRQGNVETLAQLCQENQILCTIAHPTENGDELISSTRIRDLLGQGKIANALQFLGSPYRIRGQVVTGEKRGRTIGFPTANLSGFDVVIPGHGVYGGTANIGEKRFLAAIHIGPNPTFNESASKVEVHLLDFSGDLYGQQISVDFELAVRDVTRFESTKDLAAQLTRDVAVIRNQLLL